MSKKKSPTRDATSAALAAPASSIQAGNSPESGSIQAEVPPGPFDHLAGRGLHELRFDELTPYVLTILEDPAAVEAAVAWIVSELTRKTNDERILAVQLAALREAASPPSAPAEVPSLDWKAIGEHVEEYVEEYEYRGEDDEGRDGGYDPNAKERSLISDAIHGLLADTDFVARFRSASPSAPAQVPGWQSIAEAPEGELLVVFWLDDEDTETPERYDFDHLDDGVWKKHAESVEYFEMVAPPESRGPKRTAPYTHFLVPGVPVSAPTVGPLVTWTDSDGSQHSMPVHQAAKVLREFFEAWPAGLDEIEASIRSHKDILASASKWLHAAYDRPPQTPECKAVLDLVDCAAGLDAAAPTVGKEQQL